MSLDALREFREGAKAPVQKHVEEEYRFIGSILAVDQSIANSGWAYIVSDTDSFVVQGTGNLKTYEMAKSHEDTLRRAVVCYRQYRSLIESFDPVLVVHEMPPVGNHMARPESSLVSAAALRMAAYDAKVTIRMVGAQRAKKVITGNGNAAKSEVKEKLLKLVPDLTRLKPINEHVIDAVALAWVAVREEPE